MGLPRVLRYHGALPGTAQEEFVAHRDGGAERSTSNGGVNGSTVPYIAQQYNRAVVKHHQQLFTSVLKGSVS